VNHLERIRRGTGRKIAGFNQGHGISAKHSFPCRACGECATAYNKHIEFRATQGAYVSIQQICPVRLNAAKVSDSSATERAMTCGISHELPEPVNIMAGNIAGIGVRRPVMLQTGIIKLSGLAEATKRCVARIANRHTGQKNTE